MSARWDGEPGADTRALLFPEAAMRLRLPVTDPEIGWVFVALVILGGALGVLWVRFRT